MSTENEHVVVGPTRLVIIDSSGRAYEKWEIKELLLSVQDNGRTLKIFVEEQSLDSTSG